MHKKCIIIVQQDMGIVLRVTDSFIVTGWKNCQNEN